MDSDRNNNSECRGSEALLLLLHVRLLNKANAIDILMDNFIEMRHHSEPSTTSLYCARNTPVVVTGSRRSRTKMDLIDLFCQNAIISINSTLSMDKEAEEDAHAGILDSSGVA